ncbi:MAG: DEAD/DEAH box helicase [Candidatus Thermoplasmatota archaeon]|nr:DEAD/DEAH box helicase [Candidatus Thermoplasmatota archaeon]
MSENSDRYFNHPKIRENSILRREYQVKIATRALNSPTLVVLPTGLGKTVVALMIIAEKLKQGQGPILILAPTKPLVEQHLEFFDRHLPDTTVGLLTGEIAPKTREEEYGRYEIMIATPQVVKNDIISGVLDISRYHAIVFDESHRGVGDYPYVFIAEMFYKDRPDGGALGLTASPGHEVSRIYEVCSNLGIENIEVRVDSDEDVKPYIQDLDVQRVKVDVSKGMRTIISLLDRLFMERANRLQRMGVLKKGGVPGIKQLLGAGNRIREMITKAGPDGGSLYQAMSLQAQAMKVAHAMELAETQGPEALYQYLDRLLNETSSPDCSKATRAITSDPLFGNILNRTSAMRSEEPPKVDAIERFVKQKLREDPNSRIIIFTHFRDTASLVRERLSRFKEIGIRPTKFVGHSSRGADKGLTQKKQKEILDLFRSGDHNVLIATSVAEEGLDIPGADLVIFYEPIPSEIRTIQRRGRTGRHSAGKVVVLMSKETRDIAYSFSARDKEMKMERQLLALRRMIKRNPLPGRKALLVKRENTDGEITLDSFKDGTRRGAEDLSIIVDQREMPSSVVEELIRADIKIRPGPLDQGDYIISDRVAIERKTAQDLSDSLVDGRLFKQIRELREKFERPILLIEGDNIFERRNITKNSLLGALASINIDYNIPVMFTRDPKETAEYMIIALKRESEKGRSTRSTPNIKGDDLRSIQVRTLSGLPGVSMITAERLIDHFGSLEKVILSTEDELIRVEGIGKKKAKEIHGSIVGSTGPN